MRRRHVWGMVAAVVVALLVLRAVPPDQAARRQADATVMAFATAVGQGELERALALTATGAYGTDPDPSGTAHRLTLSEAEAAGLLSSLGRDSGQSPAGAAVALRRQSALVQAEFGAEAWREVVCSLEPMPDLDGGLGRFVSTVTSLMGSAVGALPQLTPAGASTPVRTYLARLDFGPDKGRGGCHSFTVVVSNRTGDWKVSDLSWCGPEELPPDV